MAVDAAHEVETLNIVRASEMVAPAVRRFPNVSELNIVSILSRHCIIDDDGGNDDEVMLHADATRRAVPFMVQFPKLRRVFLGGLDEGDGDLVTYSNDPGTAITPHDHQIVFRGLIENLCGAFEARLLNSNLELGGLENLKDQLGCSRIADEGEIVNGLCRCCRGIIASFPIKFVANILRWGPAYGGFCVPILARLDFFTNKRRDGKAFLRTDDGKDLIAEITNLMIRQNMGLIVPSSHVLFDYSRNDPGVDAFIKKMNGLGAETVVPNGDVWVEFMVQRSIRRLKQSIAGIFDCSIDNIPRHLFGSRVPRVLRYCHRNYRGDNKKKIVVRQTFEGLVSCGFPLNPQDYILVNVDELPTHARVKEEIERDE